MVEIRGFNLKEKIPREQRFSGGCGPGSVVGRRGRGRRRRRWRQRRSGAAMAEGGLREGQEGAVAVQREGRRRERRRRSGRRRRGRKGGEENGETSSCPWEPWEQENHGGAVRHSSSALCELEHRWRSGKVQGERVSTPGQLLLEGAGTGGGGWDRWRGLGQVEGAGLTCMEEGGHHTGFTHSVPPSCICIYIATTTTQQLQQQLQLQLHVRTY